MTRPESFVLAKPFTVIFMVVISIICCDSNESNKDNLTVNSLLPHANGTYTYLVSYANDSLSIEVQYLSVVFPALWDTSIRFIKIDLENPFPWDTIVIYAGTLSYWDPYDSFFCGVVPDEWVEKTVVIIPGLQSGSTAKTPISCLIATHMGEGEMLYSLWHPNDREVLTMVEKGIKKERFTGKSIRFCHSYSEYLSNPKDPSWSECDVEMYEVVYDVEVGISNLKYYQGRRLNSQEDDMIPIVRNINLVFSMELIAYH